jgi:hypothetical protein
MEVGQGPNWGCSAEGKKKMNCISPNSAVINLLTVFGFTVYATICQFFCYITCFDPKGSSSGVSEDLEFNFHCVSFTFFTCFELLILKISVEIRLQVFRDT